MEAKHASVLCLLLLLCSASGACSSSIDDCPTASTNAELGVRPHPRPHHPHPPGKNDDVECSPPAPPYGTELGSFAAPFVLSDCGGQPYELYGPDYCGSTFTVVNLVAGWCAPCQRQSMLLTSSLSEAYADRGVRVIQVLLQNASFGPPDSSFCSAWRDRFQLSGNVELIDPELVTYPYVAEGALPTTLVLDGDGVIRGIAPGDQDFAATIATLDASFP